jgi:hypothetical protein
MVLRYKHVFLTELRSPLRYAGLLKAQTHLPATGEACSSVVLPRK